MDDIREMLKQIQENMATKSDIEELKKEMARHDDVMAMAETLENITHETAVSLEKKQESNDVLLKSLLDGLESRMSIRLDRIESNISNRFDQIFDIMRSWVSKQTEIEDQIKELKRKIDGDN
jgi:hypothetical protein